MADGIIMRVESVRLIVVGNVNSSVTRLASSIEVRSTLHVEHKVPHDGRLAMLQYGVQRHIHHVVSQRGVKVPSIVPCSDGGFREDKLLVGIEVVDDVQLVAVAAIIV